MVFLKASLKIPSGTLQKLFSANGSLTLAAEPEERGGEDLCGVGLLREVEVTAQPTEEKRERGKPSRKGSECPFHWQQTAKNRQ